MNNNFLPLYIFVSGCVLLLVWLFLGAILAPVLRQLNKWLKKLFTSIWAPFIVVPGAVVYWSLWWLIGTYFNLI